MTRYVAPRGHFWASLLRLGEVLEGICSGRHSRAGHLGRAVLDGRPDILPDRFGRLYAALPAFEVADAPRVALGDVLGCNHSLPPCGPRGCRGRGREDGPPAMADQVTCQKPDHVLCSACADCKGYNTNKTGHIVVEGNTVLGGREGWFSPLSQTGHTCRVRVRSELPVLARTSPYEHCACLSCGDLDGLPPLLPLKSLSLSLKLILCVLILVDSTWCHLYLHPPSRTTFQARWLHGFDLGSWVRVPK